jgi:hypothetical protein
MWFCAVLQFLRCGKKKATQLLESRMTVDRNPKRLLVATVQAIAVQTGRTAPRSLGHGKPHESPLGWLMRAVMYPAPI